MKARPTNKKRNHPTNQTGRLAPSYVLKPRNYSSLPLDPPQAILHFVEEYTSATAPELARPGTRFLLSCPFIYFRLREIDKRIWLTLIFTNCPARGFGRTGLSWLCQLADQFGVFLYLMVGRPERLGPQFLSNEALKAWYVRYGFREWGQENGKPVMVRLPQVR